MVKNFDSDNFVDRLKSNCRLIEIKEFQADEIITTLLSKRNQFCILLEGEAQLITYDKNGNKKILYYYKPNDTLSLPMIKMAIRKFYIIIRKMMYLVNLSLKFIWIESYLF